MGRHWMCSITDQDSTAFDIRWERVLIPKLPKFNIRCVSIYEPVSKRSSFRLRKKAYLKYSTIAGGKSVNREISSSLSPAADQDSLVASLRDLSGTMQTKFSNSKFRHGYITTDRLV